MRRREVVVQWRRRLTQQPETVNETQTAGELMRSGKRSSDGIGCDSGPSGAVISRIEPNGGKQLSAKNSRPTLAEMSGR